MKEAEITAGEFVKTRKDATKMLDLIDETLHQMALTLQPNIVVTRLFAALMRWNDWLRASFKHKVDKVLTCVASVCNHMLTGKTVGHFDRFDAIVSLACGQAHTQGVAQTIDRHMNFGAEPTSATSQCLLHLPACFFVRQQHKDERGLPCYQSARFPYRGLEQSIQTSLAKRLHRTSAKSAYTHCSSFHKRLAVIATVPRYAISKAHLLRIVGTFALTLCRCLCIMAETARFSAIVRQLVVSSCGYYATNVNTT